MTDLATLAIFLNARLGEDERRAQAALRCPGCADVAATLLRQIQATRAIILDAFQPRGHEHTLRHFAAHYSTHPSYNPEWNPDRQAVLQPRMYARPPIFSYAPSPATPPCNQRSLQPKT